MRYCLKLPIVILVLIFGLAGCAALPGPGDHLIETRLALTGACQSLGIVNETADAGHLSTFMARSIMVRKVERHAAQLGATHIVWLHKTDTSAAAHVFRCPLSEPDPERILGGSPADSPASDTSID